MVICMRVIVGAERLSQYDGLFRRKRIGLITNFSGISPDWSRDTIHLLVDAGYDLVKIFTPEHGLYGAEAGKSVEDTRHPKLGIPVVSLYGNRRTSAQKDLEDLDILVYDIQDVGLRYYTYVYTMCYALRAAAEVGLPYVVLDRPNPLGGRIVSGARIDAEIHSFVGDYELPMRYGLTIGEMAGYYLKYAGARADLTVITLLRGAVHRHGRHLCGREGAGEGRQNCIQAPFLCAQYQQISGGAVLRPGISPPEAGL